MILTIFIINVLTSLAFGSIIKSSTTEINNYLKLRSTIIRHETDKYFGSDVVLTPTEKLANEILMNFKMNEIKNATNPEFYKFSRPFPMYINQIENSNVYKIIRSMPKGALLHAHSKGTVNADFLVRLTYLHFLYICIQNNNIEFMFSRDTPKKYCKSSWQLVSEARKVQGKERFDSKLREHFVLFSKKDTLIHDKNTMWKTFENAFSVLNTLVTYKPACEMLMYEILKQAYEDNVMYIEFRSSMENLYNLDGPIRDKTYFLKMVHHIVEQFKAHHPDYTGIKFVLSANRNTNMKKIEELISFARQAKIEIPNMIAGLDFVGQEENSRTLLELIPILNEIKGEFKFFFHAGETNTFGTRADENLYDAILLNSTRIGHGYSLIKHPWLMDYVKRNEIAIEVCVISNMMLALLYDARNHPLATLLSNDVPVVLASDDPGLWDAKPLSHDFYISFMSVANQKADLRLLKKLALNSIKYNVLTGEQKNKMYNVFKKRWNLFINGVLTKHALTLESYISKLETNIMHSVWTNA